MHLSTPPECLLPAQQLLEQNRVRREPSSQGVQSRGRIRQEDDDRCVNGVRGAQGCRGSTEKKRLHQAKEEWSVGRQAAECKAEGNLGVPAEGITRAPMALQNGGNMAAQKNLTGLFLM